PCGAANTGSGTAHRLRPGIRARGGRVRIGHLHRRQSADGVGDRAAHHHHQAGAVRLRRCYRGGRRHARRLVPHAADHQRPAELDRPWAGEGAPMTAATSLTSAARRAARFEANPATRDPPWIKAVVLTISVAFFALFLLLPLVAVFVEAFRKGWEAY